MNLVMLPMWILSGVFFSATRFPAVIQPFVRALPLTAAIDALRSILQHWVFEQGAVAPERVAADPLPLCKDPSGHRQPDRGG